MSIRFHVNAILIISHCLSSQMTHRSQYFNPLLTFLSRLNEETRKVFLFSYEMGWSFVFKQYFEIQEEEKCLKSTFSIPQSPYVHEFIYIAECDTTPVQHIVHTFYFIRNIVHIDLYESRNEMGQNKNIYSIKQSSDVVRSSHDSMYTELSNFNECDSNTFINRKIQKDINKQKSIASRYNIKKREEVQEMPQEEPNPLMRKKKTPEELAAEAEAEDEDELTKLKNVIETHVMDIKTQIETYGSITRTASATSCVIVVGDDGVGGKCGRGVTAGEMNRGGRRDEEYMAELSKTIVDGPAIRRRKKTETRVGNVREQVKRRPEEENGTWQSSKKGLEHELTKIECESYSTTNIDSTNRRCDAKITNELKREEERTNGKQREKKEEEEEEESGISDELSHEGSRAMNEWRKSNKWKE
ncbi:complexin isoform X1 [Vespula maculifrons]|uniref:Complexin isoform X1 n=1 Tax=Vespula maculifrons TaxID=7453 RepID=A0ABD2CMU0_VESMC